MHQVGGPDLGVVVENEKQNDEEDEQKGHANFPDPGEEPVIDRNTHPAAKEGTCRVNEQLEKGNENGAQKQDEHDVFEQLSRIGEIVVFQHEQAQKQAVGGNEQAHDSEAPVNDQVGNGCAGFAQPVAHLPRLNCTFLQLRLIDFACEKVGNAGNQGNDAHKDKRPGEQFPPLFPFFRGAGQGLIQILETGNRPGTGGWFFGTGLFPTLGALFRHGKVGLCLFRILRQLLANPVRNLAPAWPRKEMTREDMVVKPLDDQLLVISTSLTAFKHLPAPEYTNISGIFPDSLPQSLRSCWVSRRRPSTAVRSCTRRVSASCISFCWSAMALVLSFMACSSLAFSFSRASICLVSS